jgi:hypothetical protein
MLIFTIAFIIIDNKAGALNGEGDIRDVCMKQNTPVERAFFMMANDVDKY